MLWSLDEFLSSVKQRTMRSDYSIQSVDATVRCNNFCAATTHFRLQYERAYRTFGSGSIARGYLNFADESKEDG